MVSIYQAGSIDHAHDDGRGWRNGLEKTYPDIEWLNPLDCHDPREGDYRREDIVPDDLELLDKADGIIVKYEHGTNCWGTPSEMGFALAVNRYTERYLPVVVWWDELGCDGIYIPNMDDTLTHSLKDASPWLTDPHTNIGVFSDRSEAVTALVDECTWNDVQPVWKRGYE